MFGKGQISVQEKNKFCYFLHRLGEQQSKKKMSIDTNIHGKLLTRIQLGRVPGTLGSDHFMHV